MAPTRFHYALFVYGIPYGSFLLIFGLLTVINKHANWLLLRTVLGVGFDDEKKKESKQESKRKPNANPANDLSQQSTENNQLGTLDQYLYIDFEEETKEDSARLSCIQRFLSDILASAILAVFVTIIFNALILSTETVKNNEKCPEFDADCYGDDGKRDVGPFDCKKGNTTSFTAIVETWWCVGWVYKDKSAKDVIDTLGTCGGLLGLVSLIVPFVYYLSFYKKCACPFSVTWIVLLIPPLALALVIWHTHPVGPSVLAIVMLSVVITMVCIGWCWAAQRSCGCPEKCCSKVCCNYSCWQALYYRYLYSILTQKSKLYPWCCCPCYSSNSHVCYKCCHDNLPGRNKYLDYCCANEADKFYKKNRELSTQLVVTVILVEPQLLANQSRSTASGSSKTLGRSGQFKELFLHSYYT